MMKKVVFSLRERSVVDKPDLSSRDSTGGTHGALMSISLDPPLDTDLDLASDRCPAAITEALGTDVLIAIAAGLAEVSSPWDLRRGEPAHERHYERVLATPSYEAWIIYWPAGTGLE